MSIGHYILIISLGEYGTRYIGALDFSRALLFIYIIYTSVSRHWLPLLPRLPRTQRAPLTINSYKVLVIDSFLDYFLGAYAFQLIIFISGLFLLSAYFTCIAIKMQPPLPRHKRDISISYTTFELHWRQYAKERIIDTGRDENYFELYDMPSSIDFSILLTELSAKHYCRTSKLFQLQNYILIQSILTLHIIIESFLVSLYF